MKTHVPKHVSAEAPPAFPGVPFTPRIGGIPPVLRPPCGEFGMAWLSRLIWAHFGASLSVFRGGFRGLHTPLGRVKITQPEGFARGRRKGGGVVLWRL